MEIQPRPTKKKTKATLSKDYVPGLAESVPDTDPAVVQPVEEEVPPQEMEAHPTDRKLATTDKDLSAHKVKVVFTARSRRSGERAEIDRGLARMYERQGKVLIIP